MAIWICANHTTVVNDVLVPHCYHFSFQKKYFREFQSHGSVSQILISIWNIGRWFKEIIKFQYTKDSTHSLSLSFAVQISLEAFQQLMHIILAKLDMMSIYSDDIVISGKTHRKFNDNLYEVVQRIQECEFHLKLKNVSFLDQR